MQLLNFTINLLTRNGLLKRISTIFVISTNHEVICITLVPGKSHKTIWKAIYTGLSRYEEVVHTATCVPLMQKWHQKINLHLTLIWNRQSHHDWTKPRQWFDANWIHFIVLLMHVWIVEGLNCSCGCSEVLKATIRCYVTFKCQKLQFKRVGND